MSTTLYRNRGSLMQEAVHTLTCCITMECARRCHPLPERPIGKFGMDMLQTSLSRHAS